MSANANKPKKAGASAFSMQKPKLRLVKNIDEHPQPESDPNLKAIIR